MPPLPVVDADRLVRALALLGYRVARQRGSHMVLVAAGRPTVTVPRHQELRRGTLRAIIREAGLTVEVMLDLLKRA